jgi:hypothetical protein
MSSLRLLLDLHHKQLPMKWLYLGLHFNGLKDKIKKSTTLQCGRGFFNKLEYIRSEDYSLLGCYTLKSHRNWTTFQRCLLPPSPGRSEEPCLGLCIAEGRTRNRGD